MSVYDKGYFVKKQGAGATLETFVAMAATYPGNLLNADDLTAGSDDDVGKIVVINDLGFSKDYSDAIASGTVIYGARVGQDMVVGVSCTTDVTAGKNVEAGGTMGVEGATAGQSIGKQYGGTDNPKSGISWIDIHG